MDKWTDTLITLLVLGAFCIGCFFSLSRANEAAQKAKNAAERITKLEERVDQLERDSLPKMFVVSAYTARKQECDATPDKTAIMRRPVPGRTVAVSQDYRQYLGWKVWIEGHGVFVVEDLMNPRYTGRIDILKPNVKSAMQFGTQQCEVVFLGPAEG